MTSFEFVLLLIGTLPGQRIEGRTKLQKVAYFFSLQLGLDRSLDYRPHFYGPYSSEIAEAASSLVALGFLTESIRTGVFDDKGFEHKKYAYELTEEGKKAVAIISKNVENGFAEKLHRTVKQFTDIVGADYVALSYAAKVFWLTKGHSDPEQDEIQNKAKTTGWDLDADQISSALTFLRDLQEQGFNPQIPSPA